MSWTITDMPDQAGRTVLVTGGTSGLGLASATALARAGARVLLTARHPERGKRACEQAGADVRGPAEAQNGGADVRGPAKARSGTVELVELDLTDLDSVRRAAADVRERTDDALHVLMNNAGVFGTPPGLTVEGFETQIGTNHMGHAALTWLLMPALRGGGHARVVTLSSLGHRGAHIDVDDLHFLRRPYTAIRAYKQSKLANLLFASELDRRLRAHGDDVISVAAHPGLTDTELLDKSMRKGRSDRVLLARVINFLTTQPLATGVLPQLYAATAPQVGGGDYIGPRGLGETRGRPGPARRSAAAKDADLARRLWDVTATATGVPPDPA